VVHVLSHVSDDGMMGADGGSVGSSLAVDGRSVVLVGTSESGKGNLSSVGSDVSGVSGLVLVASSDGVDSDGTSHSGVSRSVDSSGMDSLVVGNTVVFEGSSSSVGTDSHPVDGLLDRSSGGIPFGVPVSVGFVLSGLVLAGGAESGSGDLVVVHGSHLGVEGFLHHLVGPLVSFDGLVVLSDFPSVSSVPSEEESVGGSGTVPGVEVAVGTDVSGTDELHVLSEVSHAGGLGLLEGTHGVEERAISERTGGSLGLSGGAVIPSLSSLSSTVGDSLLSVSLEAVHSLLAVGVSVTISFAHGETVSSFTVNTVTVKVSGGGGGDEAGE